MSYAFSDDQLFCTLTTKSGVITLKYVSAYDLITQ